MRRQAPIPSPDGVFDADAVWTLFEGRVDRMRQVWMITQASLPAYVESLATAVDAEDWPTAARHAHSVAGSAANFGAHVLVATARRIEDDARHGGVPVAEVVAVRAQFDALCAAMAAWLDLVGVQSGMAQQTRSGS
jgi:HPt (histidine-containing phosphotransfer) domain-containing protein